MLSALKSWRSHLSLGWKFKLSTINYYSLFYIAHRCTESQHHDGLLSLFSNSSEPGCWNTALYGPLQFPFHRSAKEHFDDSFALRLRKVLPAGEVLRIQNPEEGHQHVLTILELFYIFAIWIWSCGYESLIILIVIVTVVACLPCFQDPVVDQTTLDQKCQMLREGWAIPTPHGCSAKAYDAAILGGFVEVVMSCALEPPKTWRGVYGSGWIANLQPFEAAGFLDRVSCLPSRSWIYRF